MISTTYAWSPDVNSGVRVVRVYDDINTAETGWHGFHTTLLRALRDWEESGLVAFQVLRQTPPERYPEGAVTFEVGPSDTPYFAYMYGHSPMENPEHVKTAARIEISARVGPSILRSLLCHEFGHVLGLDHQPDGSGSIMDRTMSADSARSPNPTDYTNLRALFA